jgi:hypothetical protein
MPDYGAAISTQGIPVDQASDDQKVLDTRWKTLNIFTEFTYSNTVILNINNPGGSLASNTNYFTIFAHNLGYLPAFDYVINSFTVSDNSQAGINQFNVYAGANNIYLVPTINTVLNANIILTINMTVRVYTLSITTEFQGSSVQGQAISNSKQSEYGVDFIKPGLASPNIINDTIDEYSFSTKLRPLNILQHGTTFSKVVIHIPYNYPKYPFYLFCEYSPSGQTYNHKCTIPEPIVGDLGFQGGRGIITSTMVSISGLQSGLQGNYAYILFKDPINI